MIEPSHDNDVLGAQQPLIYDELLAEGYIDPLPPTDRACQSIKEPSVGPVD